MYNDHNESIPYSEISQLHKEIDELSTRIDEFSMKSEMSDHQIKRVLEIKTPQSVLALKSYTLKLS